MDAMNNPAEDFRFKIVYYGPGLSGKTTNLDYLYANAKARAKGKVVTTTTRTDRTIFFDFVPIEYGDVQGNPVRFVLYTVPGEVYYNATRKLVLDGADAVVFVADSSVNKLQENVEILRNLEENLNDLGMSLDNLPWVIQYNKRDVPDAVPIGRLHEHLNLLGVPAFEAVAKDGKGVHETLNSIISVLHARLVEEIDSAAFTTAPKDAANSGQDAEKSVQKAAQNPEHEGELSDAVDAAFREVGVGKAKAPTEPSTAKPQPAVPAPKEPVPVGVGGGDRSPGQEPRAGATAPAPKETGAQRQAKDLWAQSVGSTADVSSVQDRPVQPPASAPEKPAPETKEPSGVAPNLAETTRLKRGDSDPPQPEADMEEDTFSFESKNKDQVPSDVGRVLELDDQVEVTDEEEIEEVPEFITDPMRPRVTMVEDEIKPPVLEPKSSDQEQHDLESQDEDLITVPVVLSRSEVQKTIPLKVVLEIRIVDD